MPTKLYVIGIGYKPLDKKAKEIILRSSVILASNRLFEVLKEYEEFDAVKDRVKVINNVDETIEFIRATVRQCDSATIILLASGDPMFFGIGRRAVREFGKDIVEIISDMSSIQIAFSRIKEPWDDAFLMSLHGGPDPEKRRRLPYEINDIPFLLQKHNKIAILTDKENNPSEIAKVLNLSPIAHSLLPVMYVCERLGYADERVISGMPEEISQMTFRDPNVVIIQKTEDRTQKTDTPLSPPFSKGGTGGFFTFGLKEGEISYSRGLITKDEVRAVTIHKLRLPQRGVLWDIGAGSGSVSIEAARLYPELKVFAVEKDEEQINHIRENKKRFNAPNIEIIKGEAPNVLNGLPLPERVFIGGSGGRLKEILNLISEVMQSGIVVINAAQIETLNDALKILKERNFETDATQLNISRMKAIGQGNCLSAINPVFVIRGIKTC